MNISRRLPLALLLGLALAPAARAVNIDQFTTLQGLLTASSGTPSASSCVGPGAGGVLTGSGNVASRCIVTTYVSGSGSTTAQVTGGQLVMTVGPSSSGQVEVTWDGDQSAGTFNASGLGGLSLKPGSEAVFSFPSATTGGSVALSAVVELHTDSTHSSRGARLVPANAVSTPQVVAFGDMWTTGSAGAGSATSVGAVILRLRMNNTTAGTVTYSVDSLDSAVSALSAVKTATPVNNPANPGDTIHYSVTITNTGAEAKTIALNDVVDTNTTVTGGTIVTTPIAKPDQYAWTCNVSLKPGSPGYGNFPLLTANDSDPQNGALTVTAVSAASTLGGTVTLDSSAGAFTYVPPAGLKGVDFFTYTLHNIAGQNSTGTAAVDLSSCIWFVQNNATAPFNGTQAKPFQTMAQAQSASAAGDTIYVMEGTSTTAGNELAGGFSLKDGQTLLGQGVDLNVTGMTAPLVTATNKPRIKSTAASTAAVIVAATTASPTLQTIRGLDFETTGATSPAIDVSSSGAFALSLSMDTNNVRGATGQGIKETDAGTGNFNVTVQTTTITSTGNGVETRLSANGVATAMVSGCTIGSAANGIDMRTLAGAGSLRPNLSSNTVTAGSTGIFIDGSAAGTTYVVGFGSNVVTGNTVGTGMFINTAKFDANPATAAYEQVSGGNTVVGASGVGNGVGASGIQMQTVTGDLAFTDLDVFADNGQGVSIIGTGALNQSGGTGTRVTVAAAVSDLEATNGPALSLTNMTASFPLAKLVSTNSTGIGLIIGQVVAAANPVFPSVVSAPSGSSISGSAGVGFSATSSTVAVTYGGTITNSTGQLVSITNSTGGSYTFSGAISGSSQGIFLNNNALSASPATIGFTGALTLSTAANPGFTATGGGTVTATDTTSTIVTTTGTALNVANTTIGAGGLKFRSISANGGANGIVLNTTGSSGGLTVSGNGGAGTGGTIKNMVGADGAVAGSGIYLNSTSSVSLAWMQLDDFQNFAIRGSSVNAFSLTNSVINGTNGNNANTPFDEGSIGFTELTGTVSLNNDSISGSVLDNFAVTNSTGTANVTLDTITFGANSSSTGNSEANVAVGGTGTLNLTVQNCTISGSRSVTIQYSMTAGTPSGTVNVLNNNINDNGTAQVAGAAGIYLTSGGAGSNPTLTYTVSGNTVSGMVGSGIAIGKGIGTGTVSGTIAGNVITGSTTLGGGNGIQIVHVGGGTETTHITNNTISKMGTDGIYLQVGDNTSGGNGTLNATVTGNTVNLQFGSFPNAAFELNNGTTTADAMFVCLSLGGSGALKNTFTASAGSPYATNEARLRMRFNDTTRLPGYGGATTDDAAVATFEAGQNTTTSGAASFTVSHGSGAATWIGGAACP